MKKSIDSRGSDDRGLLDMDRPPFGVDFNRTLRS